MRQRGTVPAVYFGASPSENAAGVKALNLAALDAFGEASGYSFSHFGRDNGNGTKMAVFKGPDSALRSTQVSQGARADELRGAAAVIAKTREKRRDAGDDGR